MQHSEEPVSKSTKPLKKQQPQDIWLIFYWAVKFLEIVGHILTLKWLLKNSIREFRRLYDAVMWFLHFKVQGYPIFEKPHARAVSGTVAIRLFHAIDTPVYIPTIHAILHVPVLRHE